MSTFSGKYYYTLDPKGRVMIPASLREVISANYGSKLYLTNTVGDGCLTVYPQEEWVLMMDKAKGLPSSNRAAKWFMRHVIGSAVEVNMDKQGRVQVPSALRVDAGLDGEIVIVGQINRIEVWDRNRWNAAMDVSAEDQGAFEKELGALGI